MFFLPVPLCFTSHNQINNFPSPPLIPQAYFLFHGALAKPDWTKAPCCVAPLKMLVSVCFSFCCCVFWQQNCHCVVLVFAFEKAATVSLVVVQQWVSRCACAWRCWIVATPASTELLHVFTYSHALCSPGFLSQIRSILCRFWFAVRNYFTVWVVGHPTYFISKLLTAHLLIGRLKFTKIQICTAIIKTLVTEFLHKEQ